MSNQSDIISLSQKKNKTKQSDDIINNEEVSITHLEKTLHEWSIPSIPTKQIYKQPTFQNVHLYLIKYY